MRITGKAGSRKVWVDGTEVQVPANAWLKAGFGWGYSGHRPHLLAEAILALFNPPEVATDRASWFVAAHVSEWPRGDFDADVPATHLDWS